MNEPGTSVPMRIGAQSGVQPMYKNSGLARFGANAGNYMPAPYTPRQFSPPTFTNGMTGSTTQAGQQGMLSGNRIGVADPSGHGISSDPYSSNNNGDWNSVGVNNGTGMSNGLAGGIGAALGSVFGMPQIGGLAGNMLNGMYNRSHAGDINPGPTSSPTIAGSVYGGGGNYGGYTTGSNQNIGTSTSQPGTPSTGPGSQQDSASYSEPSSTMSTANSFRGDQRMFRAADTSGSIK